MPRRGEPPKHRRRLWLLIGLLAIPFIVGAAAPMSARWVADEPTPISVDLRAPDTVRATPPATARPDPPTAIVHPVETVQRPTAGTPPPAPKLTARFTDLPPLGAERALPPPILRPGDPGWVATRLQVPALGIDVAVRMAATNAHEAFPPSDGAYILRSSSQPGRGTNSYLFAHAVPTLFKPLWWAGIGQQVIVTMSDGQQLGYRVTAVVRNIPCPDPNAPKPAGLPPVLANATECDLRWTLPTASERLTMQTSQGFNRNYGEMVVIAEPDW